MKKFLKCIISGVLVLSLLIAPLRNYSLAMTNSSPASSSPIQSTETSIATTKLTLPAILVTAVSFAVAGTVGYFIGNHQYLKYSKEITFKGSAASSKSEIPTGTIYPIPLARQLLNRIIKEDIPKLKDNNELPAGCIADLETYLWMISGNLGTEPLAQEILTMSQIMSGLISTEDKKVTVGYLIDLLKQSQDLINQAEAQASEKFEL